MKKRIAALALVAASLSGVTGAVVVAEHDSREKPIKAEQCVQEDCTAPRPLR